MSGDSSPSLSGLSSSGEVTFAMLVMVPFAFTLTIRSMICESDASMLVKFHVRFCPSTRGAGLANSKVSSGGKVSTTVTFVAVPLPMLVTVMV